MSCSKSRAVGGHAEGTQKGSQTARKRATIEEYSTTYYKEDKEEKKGAAPGVSPSADYEGMAWEDLPPEERARRLRR